MEPVKDLIGGNKPEPILIHYNGDLAVSSVTKRYAGSFVKLMDIDDADNGWFFTFGGLATALENTVGILAEDQPITGNYLPNNATLGMGTKLMYPIFPSTVIRAEYARADKAGTANTDTGATCAAGSAAFTAAATGTADYTIGGWIYMVTGAAAGELHYVLDDDGAGAVTLATAMTNAVVAADTFLFIWPSCTNHVRWDGTYSGLMSEIDSSACVKNIQGFMHYITSPGVPLQPLSRDLHDGLVVTDARFFHDFVYTGATDAASGLTSLVTIRGQAAA
jgi:hypothetical protein